MKDHQTLSDIDSYSITLDEDRSIIFLLTVKASVAFLEAHSSLRQGLEKMRNRGYTAMPVVAEDGTYIGTVSEGDFLRHMLDTGIYGMKSQENYPITAILREGWNPAARIDTTMDELFLRIMDQNFVPVIDDRGKFVGIITRKKILEYYYDLIKEHKSIPRTTS